MLRALGMAISSLLVIPPCLESAEDWIAGPSPAMTPLLVLAKEAPNEG
jgi:hypothetical protein